MTTLGGYSPETARLIYETVRYLRESGFVIQPPGRGDQRIAPPTPIYVRNDSGETIPAWACMQSTGTVEDSNQNFVTVDKPDDITGTAGSYFFNGQQEIPAGEYGVAFEGPFVRAYKNSGSITSGGKCRPTIGQWYVTIDTAGQWSMVGGDDIGTDVMRISTQGWVTLTVITNIQVSGTTLQYKTRSITVPAAGTESGWTTWHTGTECPA